jgi:prepilin-type N-terminal cleavage/methylation domain-containing protein
MNMNKKGFTLIELLIVVAIIAILAAIAIPNFLEAQTRSKISRAKSDLRSFATAVESYAVDNNRPPLDASDWKHIHGGSEASSMALGIGFYSLLTTPISYINGFLYDPFSDPAAMSYDKVYSYITYKYLDGPDPTDASKPNPNSRSNFDTYRSAPQAKGYTWGVTASGPKLSTNGEPPLLVRLCAGDMGNTDSAAPGYDAHGTGRNDNYWGCLGQLYDPTNGTVSRGRIYDTNKGFLEAGHIMANF